MDLSVIDTPTLQAWHIDAITKFGQMPAGGLETALSYSTPGSSRSASFSAMNWGDLQRWIGMLQDELVRRGILAGQRRRRFAIGLRF